MSSPFTSLTNCKAGIVLSGGGTLAIPGLQNPIDNSMDAGSVSVVNFTLGSGAGAINKIIDLYRTIAASGTDNVDFTALTDLMGQATSALTSICAICIQHLSVAQDATNGRSASSLTIGNAASNAWTGGFLSGTNTVPLANGQSLFVMDPSSGAMTIGSSSKILKVLNADSVNAAGYRLTILGRN